MDEILKYLLSAASGGLLIKLVEIIAMRRKYSEEVNKMSSDEWKQLYSEVKKTLVEQEIKLDKLQLMCDELRLKNIDLQHQIKFKTEIE